VPARARRHPQEFVTEGVDPEKPTMQRQFAVRPSEPIGITNGGTRTATVRLPYWSTSVSGTTVGSLVERDVAALVGCKREGVASSGN